MVRFRILQEEEYQQAYRCPSYTRVSRKRVTRSLTLSEYFAQCEILGVRQIYMTTKVTAQSFQCQLVLGKIIRPALVHAAHEFNDRDRANGVNEVLVDVVSAFNQSEGAIHISRRSVPRTPWAASTKTEVSRSILGTCKEDIDPSTTFPWFWRSSCYLNIMQNNKPCE